MKRYYLLFLFIFLCIYSYSQQWYNMGNIDTTSIGNGNKGVLSITNFNNRIVVGGSFKRTGTTVLNGVAQWSWNNWQPMSTGLWSILSNDTTGGALDLCGYHSKLYACGGFEGAGGTILDATHYAFNIAKWDTSDWYPMTQPADGFNNGCDAMGVYHNNLYIGTFGGNAFDSSGMVATNGIARWNDTVFSAVGQLSGDFPVWGYFAAMAFTNYNDKLIVGGYFTSIDGSPYGTYNGIASWNDTAWDSLGNGFNNAVYALTVFNGELYAGGCFTSSRNGATPLNHIAKWAGSNWAQVGEGLNDTVYSLTVDSVHNKLIAGGGFT